MERCKKSLVPTEKGLALNSVVKTMRIADVAMTGEWEKELARIERGELPADTFRKEIEAYTREITSELLSCDKLFGSRLRVSQVRHGQDAVLRQGGTLRQHGVRTARVPAESGTHPVRRRNQRPAHRRAHQAAQRLQEQAGQELRCHSRL